MAVTHVGGIRQQQTFVVVQHLSAAQASASALLHAARRTVQALLSHFASLTVYADKLRHQQQHRKRCGHCYQHHIATKQKKQTYPIRVTVWVPMDVGDIIGTSVGASGVLIANSLILVLSLSIGASCALRHIGTRAVLANSTFHTEHASSTSRTATILQ
jgi:hypothetical protein